MLQVRPMSTKTKATLADLYRVKDKAELVEGEIVHMAPTGWKPNYAGGEIFTPIFDDQPRPRPGCSGR